MSEKWWRELGEVLVQEGYLTEKSVSKFTIIKLGAKGWTAVKQDPITASSNGGGGNVSIMIPSTSGLLKEYKASKSALRGEVLAKAEANRANLQQKIKDKAPIVDISLISELLTRLIVFRKQLSSQLNIPPYIVFSEKSLRGISQTRPLTLERLQQIDGMEVKKVKDHGQAIISIVEQFCKEKSIFDNNNNNNNNNGSISPGKKVTTVSPPSLRRPSTGLNLYNVVINLDDEDEQDQEQIEIDKDNDSEDEDLEESKSLLNVKRKRDIEEEQDDQPDEDMIDDRDSIFMDDIDSSFQEQLDQHIEKKNKLSTPTTSASTTTTTTTTSTTTTTNISPSVSRNGSGSLKLLPLIPRASSKDSILSSKIPPDTSDSTYFIYSFNNKIDTPDTARLLSIFKSMRANSLSSRYSN
ncbi:hypothetical protein PPL_03616 [Heterostelium album PN500]|uniref:HRDC domain-containing protein n=1 Tax=Heterostelium pallidum (strain ATCC 26659 / Pp 5 / PN500) TaxID=670386 RepID=D3B5A3_HETP5|nr:hypothetical protein PPL_03616 [Heterostelium album PN500]EFA83468.1 hypothetical protein PPL_03616 [Heterostelium album PN500]|eukprot:XP_020435585.1 hypothetical protein PPL_03616 [Heterostelium album PN500]